MFAALDVAIHAKKRGLFFFSNVVLKLSVLNLNF